MPDNLNIKIDGPFRPLSGRWAGANGLMDKLNKAFMKGKDFDLMKEKWNSFRKQQPKYEFGRFGHFWMSADKIYDKGNKAVPADQTDWYGNVFSMPLTVRENLTLWIGDYMDSDNAKQLRFCLLGTLGHTQAARIENDDTITILVLCGENDEPHSAPSPAAAKTNAKVNASGSKKNRKGPADESSAKASAKK